MQPLNPAAATLYVPTLAPTSSSTSAGVSSASQSPHPRLVDEEEVEVQTEFGAFHVEHHASVPNLQRVAVALMLDRDRLAEAPPERDQPAGVRERGKAEEQRRVALAERRAPGRDAGRERALGVQRAIQERGHGEQSVDRAQRRRPGAMPAQRQPQSQRVQVGVAGRQREGAAQTGDGPPERQARQAARHRVGAFPEGTRTPVAVDAGGLSHEWFQGFPSHPLLWRPPGVNRGTVILAFRRGSR